MFHRLHSLMMVFAIVSILALAVPARSTLAFSALRPVAAASPYDLINAVNALRASYGLPPYSISPILMAVAQAHADYMAATGTLSHTGLGGSSVTDRLLAAGYPLAGDLSLGGFRSENISSGSETRSAQDVVDGWTGDAPHLTTMISPNLTEIGAGVSVNGGKVYFVIDCAQPTGSANPQVVVTSASGGSTVVPSGGVILPVSVATPDTDGDVIHEVQAGQTLWQIAISYETRIDEIKRLNNLVGNDIYPGTKLLVKKGMIVSPTRPVETRQVEEAASPGTLSSATATILIPTSSATPGPIGTATSRETVVKIAIGIVALALLGGGLFVRWGSPKKTDS